MQFRTRVYNLSDGVKQQTIVEKYELAKLCGNHFLCKKHFSYVQAINTADKKTLSHVLALILTSTLLHRHLSV
jgi:hypothetical protein